MSGWQTVEGEQAMLALGAELAHRLPQGGLVTLHGDLGAGKTTLVRGLLRELGHTGKVKSPTYTLVEPYAIAERDVYHFDLYRLADPQELEYLGFRDYLHPDALCLVEWPEKAQGMLPPADMEIYLLHAGSARHVLIRTI